MGRKVIFLDIDGVLQPLSSEKRFDHDLDKLQEKFAKEVNPEYAKMDKYDIGAVYYDWHPEAVQNLKDLIKAAGADIVISSAWKDFSDLNRLKLLFKIQDLDKYITDVTYDTYHFYERFRKEKQYRYRWEEIAHYLEEHPEIEKFVILDDAYAYDYEEHFPEKYIKTKPYFTREDYKKALEILCVPNKN